MSAKLSPAVALAGFLGATVCVGVVGGLVSAPNISSWYAHLNKPPFTPPGAIFAPVWIILYVAMAVAAWLSWRTPTSSARSASLRLWWIQLAANLSWTILFFGFHSPGVALIVFSLLLVTIVLTMRSFYAIQPSATWLFAPYLAWCVLAFYLNAGILALNR